MIRPTNKTIASASPVTEPFEHVVLYDVSWAAYESILEAFGDRRLRHSYNDGTLEIMSPLKRHDWHKKLLSRLVEITALELDIDIQSIGSTTLRKQPRRKGLEPDECYYVANEPIVRGKDDYDPQRDPPPDLAIEVDVTHADVDRMDIYSGLGVPEVWRLKDNELKFFRLSKNGKYVKLLWSLAFPMLSAEILVKFLLMREEMGENNVVRSYLTWLRHNAT